MFFKKINKDTLPRDYSSEDEPENLPEKGGFLDLDFAIKDQKKTDSDFINVYASGFWQNKPVNIWIDNIPMKAEPFLIMVDGEYKQNPNSYKGAVSIFFEQQFVELYAYYCKETVAKNKNDKRKVGATLIALTPWQIELNGGVQRFKLFFEQDPENYAELFLNFNIKDSQIELHEKDVEYRKNIFNIINS